MDELKIKVKTKYASIATQVLTEGDAICSQSRDHADISEDASTSTGYVVEADLALGCGMPVKFAMISQGDVVMDLGCGAGSDCFIASTETGPQGKVIGLDFVDAMIVRAERNRKALNINNISFIIGDIESIPLKDESVDVVISNCALNLVPNKQKAYAEIYRILRREGHFSVSDLVMDGPFPAVFQQIAEEYTGCVSGAIQLTEYLNIIKSAGFNDIEVQKKRAIELPKELLVNHLNDDDFSHVSNFYGIYSINLFARKC